jgi:hypothetical protein
MLANWVHVNRHAASTLLVVPGWGLLPGYFSDSLPHHNLWVLNTFLDDAATPGYLQQALGNHDYCVVNQPVTAIVSNCDALFICSMGLQWADAHVPNWAMHPMVLASPSRNYCHLELRAMNRRLIRSPRATLRAFYKACFGSSGAWAWWVSRHLDAHLDCNSTAALTHWLTTVGNREVRIPAHATGQILIDPNDPIGKKHSLDNGDQWVIEQLPSHLVQHWPVDGNG